MNEQYSGARFYTPAIDERTDRDMNVPAASSDPLTDNIPVESALLDETPLGETIVDKAATAESPYAAPLDELVAGGSGATTSIPYTAPVGEPVAGVALVSTSIPYVSQVVDTMAQQAPVVVSAATAAALLNREVSEHLRTRWNEIQGTFVDDPRTAVQQADALVSEAVEQITQMFAGERSALESQWKQNNDVSTEDLRKALQRYRSFFNRLVV
jgi:hypothetical protein